MEIVKRDTRRVPMTMKEGVGVVRRTMVICRSPGQIDSYFPYLLEFVLCTGPVWFRNKS